MKCSRCQNEDNNYFYLGSKGIYCRKCITFKRQLLMEDNNEVILDEISENISDYTLSYDLTKLQKDISKKCAETIKNQDVLIHCVCGAGKTEIVLESISNALKSKQKVCFAISRRQVVLEIKARLEKIFKEAKVIAVCQGYTKILDGDLIVCTTHQLYRYPNSFDLLIIDEPDAFPYKGNEVLQGIALNSCKGHIIYSTATIDKDLKKKVNDNTVKHLMLNRRPHGYDLPVPKVVTSFKLYLFYKLIKFIKSHQEKIIVFLPSKKLCEKYCHLFNYIFSCCYITSESIDKDLIISEFRKDKYKVLFATSILERGITIEGVLVVVMYCEHLVYDEASIIQMLGRVGRSFKCPYGDTLLLNNKKNLTTINVIKSLKEANGH